MMINMHNYKPSKGLTKEILRENNFKYMDGYYTYRFSVYSYKKEPLLWAVLYVDIENMCCYVNVVNHNNITYPAYHNRENTSHSVVEEIDKKIKTQINKFVKEEILVQKKGKAKK